MAGTGPGQSGTSTAVLCKVTRSVAYNLVNAAVTAFPWDAEEDDDLGFHDNVTQNTRLTVPAGQGGWYLVQGCLASAGAITSRFLVTVRKNGSDIKGATSELVGSGSGSPALPFSAVVELAATDYIDVSYYQDSGSVKATEVGKVGCSLIKLGS